MRVLVDVGHPAQVHFFKNLIATLSGRGHEVLVTARAKDVTTDLLDSMGIPWVTLGKRRTGTVGLGVEYATRIVRLMKVARRFRPDAMVAPTGVTIGPVGLVLGIPRIVYEETEHARVQRMLGLPFATRIMTGSGYRGKHGKREVKFKGYWEEAYLDDRYFRPDREVLRRAGLPPDERIIVVRRVSWDAMHDVGSSGIGMGQLADAARRLERFGRVIVSAEGGLPEDLKRYANPVATENMHHLLAFASMYVGDGGTMAAEAALLGTPTVYTNKLLCGYLTDLADRYGLILLANSFEDGVRTAEELLARGGAKEEWRRRREKVPKCEDITEMMYGVIEEAVGKKGKEERKLFATAKENEKGPAVAPSDYAWSSIVLGTRNVGNRLIERALERALKLGEPRIRFDSFEELSDETAERMNRECRFVLSPGCTVFEPGQNRAYERFERIAVPKPCFGGCFWGARRGRAGAMAAMILPGRTPGKTTSDVRLARKLTEPVGVRDPYTLEVLKAAEIEARLIGCPTLMTERAATGWRKPEGRHAVVSLGREGIPTQLRLIRKLSKDWRVTVLVHEAHERRALGLLRGIEVVEFESSEQFTEFYAEADLVVTGRLHGLLPAVAHGTPVIFYGNVGDTRLTLASWLGITIHTLSVDLADAAKRREITAPLEATFERLAELRKAFVAYAREYGIETRIEI